MEVLKLTTTVNPSGHVVLDIPTQLPPGEVNIVLVLNSVPAPQLMKYDFSDLVGGLTWQGDAVATQRALRDEW
jgi:hypothetical protein